MGYKFNPLTGAFDLVNSATAGTGDVTGPASSTDNAIVLYDGTTGTTIKDSGITIADLISSVNYSDTFNATSDWTGPSGGSYSLTVLKTTHNKDAPIVQLFELSGSDYILVETGVKIDTSENVIITVNSTPDLRFVGKIVIS